MIERTHTYVELELSPIAYEEIARKLREAGYHQAFDGETIDMHGLAVIPNGDPMRRCTQCGWIVDTKSEPVFPDSIPRVQKKGS